MENKQNSSDKAHSEPLQQTDVIGSCDTLIFKYIEEKHDKFYETELKEDLYYAVALDKNDDILGEVCGYESYCEDCKEKARKNFNKLRRENVNQLDINCDDSDYKNVKKIVMHSEFSPEKDDFTNCEMCGSLINVGVLHTFSQEIEHYLSEDKNLHIKHLKNDDFYRLHLLIEEANDKYPDLIEKLKLKIIQQNN